MHIRMRHDLMLSYVFPIDMFACGYILLATDSNIMYTDSITLLCIAIDTSLSHYMQPGYNYISV